jgi:hypothetical protein
MIARQDGACTFASVSIILSTRMINRCENFFQGSPPIPNGSNGCVPNTGLGGSPGVITCNNGVPTEKDCGVFTSCGGDNGKAKCSFLGL